MGRISSAALTGSCFLALLVCGCASQRTSEPKRTANEQLLISTAADRAVHQASVLVLEGKKVYVSPVYFESLDQPYVLGTIRNMLFSRGVLVVDSIEEAEIVLEPRSGALSINSSESLAGIPEMRVPIPLAGTTHTPEVAFFKTERQNSLAKLLMVAYEKESREHVMSTGSLVGEAKLVHYRLLGIVNFRATDIPEKKMWRSGR